MELYDVVVYQRKETKLDGTAVFEQIRIVCVSLLVTVISCICECSLSNIVLGKKLLREFLNVPVEVDYGYQF